MGIVGDKKMMSRLAKVGNVYCSLLASVKLLPNGTMDKIKTQLELWVRKYRHRCPHSNVSPIPDEFPN